MAPATPTKTANKRRADGDSATVGSPPKKTRSQDQNEAQTTELAHANSTQETESDLSVPGTVTDAATLENTAIQHAQPTVSHAARPHPLPVVSETLVEQRLPLQALTLGAQVSTEAAAVIPTYQTVGIADRSYFSEYYVTRFNKLLTYANSACYAVQRLPASLDWGRPGAGADNKSAYMCEVGGTREVTVWILGEWISATRRNKKTGTISKQLSAGVKPLLATDTAWCADFLSKKSMPPLPLSQNYADVGVWARCWLQLKDVPAYDHESVNAFRECYDARNGLKRGGNHESISVSDIAQNDVVLLEARLHRWPTGSAKSKTTWTTWMSQLELRKVYLICAVQPLLQGDAGPADQEEI